MSFPGAVSVSFLWADVSVVGKERRRFVACPLGFKLGTAGRGWAWLGLGMARHGKVFFKEAR